MPSCSSPERHFATPRSSQTPWRPGGRGRTTSADADVELIDAGDGRRLERFGERIVDRPHPAAIFPPRDPSAWRGPDLRYDRGDGWSGVPAALAPWTISLAGVSLVLRPASGGQLGCFPEHAAAARWVSDLAAARSGGPPFRVLNLFGYTGLVTLAAARAGAAVTHVDSSRPAVAWARLNAAASGLGDAPVRWIVDDAAAYATREGRRAHRYDAIVMDPPSYGHAGARTWRIERDLGALIDASLPLLEPGTGFLHVTSHSPALWDDALARLVADATGLPARRIETRELRLHARSGIELILGTAAVAAS